MNKLIKINETKVEKYYKSTNKSYQISKKTLTYECSICKEQLTVNISSPKEDKKGSIEFFLNKPCINCVKKQKALDRLLNKAIEKFPNKEFDYSLISLSNFSTGYASVPIKCNKHNLVFNTPLYNHTDKYRGPDNPNKGGCPECAKESQQSAETFTVQDWNHRLNYLFPHISFKTDLKPSDNLEGFTRINFECEHHGTFESNLHNMSKSVYFCPLCAQDNNSWGGRFRRTDIAGTLYLIYIPVLKVWKLGVTKDTVEFRQKDLSYEYEIVWTQHFLTLSEAYAEETRLFRKYKDNRLKGVPKGLLGKAKGITELLNCSIPLTEVSHS